MKITSRMIIIAAALAVGGNGVAIGADKKAKTDWGKREYQNSCALCHGTDGKGSGSILDLLKKAPPDLTVLSKKNNGVFPFDRVYETIDGRQQIKAHGERDMPAWGDRYSTDTAKAAEYYVDVPYDMEMYARSRILALIDYLNRLQAK